MAAFSVTLVCISFWTNTRKKIEFEKNYRPTKIFRNGKQFAESPSLFLTSKKS